MSSAAAPARRRTTPPRLAGSSLGWLAVAAVAAAALVLAWKAGVKGVGGVPPALQVGGAVVLLFGLPGYAVTAFTLPEPLRMHLPLFVLPIGACVSALALTVLGFAQLPLTASLVVVIALGAVGSAVAWRRREPTPGATGLSALAAPAALAVVIACVGMLPMLRAGEGVLTGANGDAVLAVGVGEFLQRTQPLGTDESLYVDRMPTNWRSKYPIYYSLAGVARLSGLPVDQAFPALIAVVLGLTAVGLMLFAFHGLSAGAAGALLVMGIVGLDRILLYLTVGPFYNQMWGEFAMAFMLLLALRLMRSPDRATAALFGLFAVLGAFAYPLMLPFPIALLAVGGAVAWRSAGSPRPRLRLGLPRPGPRRVLVIVLLVLIVAPALLVAGLGVLEKSWAAAKVIGPGSDLRPWNALPIYLPFHQFFGLTDPLRVAGAVSVGLIGLAFFGLRRQPREVALALGAMLAGALAFAVYFRIRDNGAFFYFKILGFAGPMVLALAVVCLVRERAASGRTLVQAACASALALLALSAVVGARFEVNQHVELFTDDTLELRSWSRQIPANDSVLLALPPSGAQLNATSMLAAHPLSSPSPLGGSTFPAVAPGARADWVLTGHRPRRATRALTLGPARFSNDTFRLYAGSPEAPGRDYSTRRSFESAPWAQAGVPIKE